MSAAHRVLFVDDEPQVLSGLRRSLRKHADRWDLRFAEGGRAALEVMAAEPVDVVVTDMLMPGMTGAELLAEVRRLHPTAGRLVLSGHADREAVIAAVASTQQFLSKPCDADRLVRAVEQVLTVRDLVLDDRLRVVLGEVQSLPKPRSVHQRILDLTAREDCDLDQVVELVESDISLCVEVLKLVSSSFFGQQREVGGIAQAVSLLGVDTIRALAISGKVFSSGATPDNLDLAALRTRSVRTAALARDIALAEGWETPVVHQAFLAGLLRDVGLLVLADSRPDAYRAITSVPEDEHWAAHDAEVAELGCSLPEVSAYLLGTWGFAMPVVRAIACAPAAAEGATGERTARAVDFARQRAVGRAHVDPAAGDWLDAARLEAWDRVCDRAAPGQGAPLREAVVQSAP
ncbi:HDOD domain-containing protein [Actinosynnema pretiosum subsp. pretiosum]|uniref:HDOD domain-containing protein n=2 Tax=Actinosynnema TaxID=40566 RepID=A0AA45L9C6_9PSEU|nr:HDOD domain-containing protein [Actinosynnema mirum]ACU36308.1 putative signal transduction protein [Actinosynnema mirum DSM 43827]AXX29761.1 Response regulator [Actinosynnema pretiosum subsp. pretiosum]QUF06024.1 HDOD domain-containing protein [Actinosynnema pretiosum subsp. pretiosum]